MGKLYEAKDTDVAPGTAPQPPPAIPAPWGLRFLNFVLRLEREDCEQKKRETSAPALKDPKP